MKAENFDDLNYIIIKKSNSSTYYYCGDYINYITGEGEMPTFSDNSDYAKTLSLREAQKLVSNWQERGVQNLEIQVV